MGVFLGNFLFFQLNGQEGVKSESDGEQGREGEVNGGEGENLSRVHAVDA